MLLWLIQAVDLLSTGLSTMDTLPVLSKAASKLVWDLFSLRIQGDFEQEQNWAGLASGRPGRGDSAPPCAATQFQENLAG